MRISKTVKNGSKRVARAALATVLALGLAPVPAFASDLQAGSLAAQDDAMSTEGYVIGAAYAAANPAPEILGLSNPNQRSTNEADQTYNFFGDADINENPNPFLWNYHNDKTPGVYVGGRQGSPMSALNPYSPDDASAAQNAVWELMPQVILGTGSDAIPENEHDFYIDRGDAAAVESALGLEAGSYKPIGVTYNRVSLPAMIETMYRLADAANEAIDNAAAEGKELKTRYGDPLEIAKDYERYIVGQKGVVLQAINAGTVNVKSIALVQSYDSAAGTYTIITDGVAEGTATTNRYLEAVQGVTTNYYDAAEGEGADKTKTVTADQLKDNVDVIIIGGQASMESGSLADYLAKDGLLDRTFYCVNWANGSAFGTTVNSVENAQNVGRILPCVYPEVLDQSDMVAYYYDVFYHLKDGVISDIIAERMDGVRNWNNSDSASYTNWEKSDVNGYDHDAVQAILQSGVDYLYTQEGQSSYLTPTDKVVTPDNFSSLEATVAADGLAYTGSALEPKVAVKDGDTELVENTDFTVTYSNNTNAAAADAANAPTATITGIGNYKGTIVKTFAIAKMATAIAAADVSKTVGDEPFALGAVAEGYDGTLTYATSDDKVVTVDNAGQVTVVGAGDATITVTAAATDNCEAATKDVKVAVKAAELPQTITAADVAKTVGDEPFDLGATALGGVTLTYASSNESVATIDESGKVTVVGEGEAVITITAVAENGYAAAVMEVKVTVSPKEAPVVQPVKKAPTITATNKSVVMGKTVKIGAKVNSGGALTYKSSNVKVAKVDKTGKITPVMVGTANITITAAAKGNFKKGTKTIKVTVKQGSQTITFKNQSKQVVLGKTVAIAKATGAKTKVTYSLVGVSKKALKKFFTVNKTTGKITVKKGKGMTKGTYKVTVKASAAKNKNWKAASKNAVITLKVK